MAATGSRTLKLSILADVDNLTKGLKQGTGDVETFGSKITDFGKKAGIAFAAAAAAAAAYAIKIGVDGVKAAVADEAAQVKLAGALEAATGATKAQVAAVEQQILKTSLATGVADDQLRPALSRLALSTNDTAKAQDLLNLALDISAQTGKPLEAVANSLGKAYDGNSTALGKLGIGLSAAELKSMTFTEQQQKLTDLFGGAAARNAETFQGRMDRLKVAFNESVETIGFALLPILQKLLEAFTTYILPIVETVTKAISDNKEGLVGAFENIVSVIKSYVMPIFEGAVTVFNKVRDAIKDNMDGFKSFFDVVKYAAPIIGELIGGSLKVIGEIASVVITVISKVLGAIKPLLNTAIDGINLVIRGLNIINPFKNIPYLPRIGDSVGSTATGALGNFSMSTGSVMESGGGTSLSFGAGGGGGGTAGTAGGSVGGSVNSTTAGISPVDQMKLLDNLQKLGEQTSTLTEAFANGSITRSQLASRLAPLVAQRDALQSQVDTLLAGSGAFYGAVSARAGEAATTNINVTVNGAIDSEGTARTVVSTLNDSFYRGTLGAGALVGAFDK